MNKLVKKGQKIILGLEDGGGGVGGLQRFTVEGISKLLNTTQEYI
jgi:hypothetical protein